MRAHSRLAAHVERHGRISTICNGIQRGEEEAIWIAVRPRRASGRALAPSIDDQPGSALPAKKRGDRSCRRAQRKRRRNRHPLRWRAAATSTAEDTLKQKSREAGVVSGGHLVAKALKAEGVDTIFTLCGGHIIDIYDGCLDEGIRIADVRHEQTAAHAADAYARQTGKLGCVVTTAGPGCTNAITGIATAFRSESPVLHIGGQSTNQWKMVAGDLPMSTWTADHQIRPDGDVDRE